jgi:signal transduction histidine kinase
MTARKQKSRKTARAAQPGGLEQKQIVDALYRVNRLIAHITDLHRLLEQIMYEGKKVVNAEASSLMLYDEEANELFFEVALGAKGEAVKTIRLKPGVGVAGHAAKRRKTIIVNDVRADKRHFKAADEKSRFVTRNILATPMLRKDKLIGVLEVLNKRKREAFTPGDARVLEFFADQAAVAIENARLIQANVQAERLAAVGQTVAGISHYVKNILAGIKGSASLIEHGLGQDNLELIQQSWPILQRSNQKISELVQDMLTYSKSRKPELAVTDLNKMCEDVVALCQSRAEQSRVTLSVKLDREMPICLCDADKIHDASLNLVTNAIDAVRECESARLPGKVEIATAFRKSTRRVELKVSDNGPGIPQEMQKKIFEPFFSTKGSKGTGLGLAVAMKVIEEHSGTLTLKSTEGKGCTFTIQLPFVPADAGKAQSSRGTKKKAKQ